MANQAYACNILTGGSSGALDNLNGSQLEDGDMAIVVTRELGVDVAYLYVLDATSGAAASSPGVILPLRNAGSKRWLLCGVEALELDVDTGDISFITGVSDKIIDQWSTDGTMAGAAQYDFPTEKAVKTYLDSFAITTPLEYDEAIGFFVRPRWLYGSASTLTFTARTGFWHIDGAEEKVVYNPSNITFTTGSAGSNSSSSDLVADTWSYLYIDDSSLATGQVLLTASNLINTNTAPSWSVTKNGWYSGNDRCIFVIPVQSGAASIERWIGGPSPSGEIELYSPKTIQNWINVQIAGVTIDVCPAEIITRHTANFRWDNNNANANDYIKITDKDGSGNQGIVTWVYSLDSIDATFVEFQSEWNGVDTQEIIIASNRNEVDLAKVVYNSFFLPEGM